MSRAMRISRRVIGVVLGGASLAAAVPLRAQTAAPQLAAAAAPNPDSLRRDAIDKLSAFLTSYPRSALRPNALFELGEMLVRQADATFAAAQRAGGNVPAQPDYSAAIARYRELVTTFPDYPQVDGAAYTLGTLYFAGQQYASAASMFSIVTAKTASPFRPESYFRLGDARFEQAATMRGAARRAMFVAAAAAYDSATLTAPHDGDIYFLALYKLGWSYYNQATQPNEPAYREAVDVFGRLVSEYDDLPPERQAQLGLRREAIEYMAVAFTQSGGAEAANQYFAQHPNSSYELVVLRRVAASLRDQGDFPKAVRAYEAVLAKAPTDSGALNAQREIVDIYQNRVLDPEQAQQARLVLVNQFGPGSPWATANPQLADSAQRVREEMLRQSAQYALAQAQKKKDKAQFAEAAELYGRYLRDFGTSDSAQASELLRGEALFGQEQYAGAGTAYTNAAYRIGKDQKLAAQAGQNAIVAYDSAIARAPGDTTMQDSLFAVVDRYVATFPNRDVATRALIEKGRRASEAGRWDVVEQTFRTFVDKFPDDKYAPTASKLIGDALYKEGKYADAQAQWEKAQAYAAQSGRRSLADSIVTLRNAAAVTYGDSLVKQGQFAKAADEVYVAFADRNPKSAKAPDALRNAIETYLLADSAARARGDSAGSQQARQQALALSQRLVSQYPTYKYRVQYQALEPQLLAELGQREQAAAALDTLVRDNPKWPGRADAMVRRAVMLDSLAKSRDAAAAYEQFAAAYPRDHRAADAQYNAAIDFLQAADSSDAARAYGTFAARFPRDARAGDAQRARLTILQAAGDSTVANAELTKLCVRPSAALAATCAERTGSREFRAGASLFAQYKAMQLVIPRRDNLTRLGVERLSAPKRRLLSLMSTHFTRAITTGIPRWLTSSSYYMGLLQWEYGNYLKNVQLPAELTGDQLSAAQAGASQQADQYFAAARKTWQALVAKAAQDHLEDSWVDRAKAALSGTVDESPPTDVAAPAPAGAPGSPAPGAH